MYWYMAGAVVCLLAAGKLHLRGVKKKKGIQIALILAGGFLLAALTSWADSAETGEKQVVRTAPGQGSQEKEFRIDVEGTLENYPITIEVEERKLTKEQRQSCLEQAKQELEWSLKGENASLDQVTRPLYLPESLQEGAVEVSYQFSDYDIIHTDGQLQQDLEKPTLVEVTAELICQGEICIYQIWVRVVPREKNQQEQFVDKIKSIVFAENQRENAECLTLPMDVEGIKIFWKEETSSISFLILLLAAALAVWLNVREKEKEKQKKEEQAQQMLMDYSGIVGKLALLLGAGMNISNAWERIAFTYRKNRENKEIELRYAYEEMLGTLYEIRDGVGELQAYENFGRRCQLGVYRRLSALIIQNVRKGSKGMQKLLEEEEWEAYEQRKVRARQAGEEAGAKLLLPMGIMLVIVLVILVVPAGMTLNF